MVAELVRVQFSRRILKSHDFSYEKFTVAERLSYVRRVAPRLAEEDLSRKPLSVIPWLCVERECVSPLQDSRRHESGWFNTFDKEEYTMGKGNNAKKNDKKDKKPKAETKKADPKAAEHKK